MDNRDWIRGQDANGRVSVVFTGPPPPNLNNYDLSGPSPLAQFARTERVYEVTLARVLNPVPASVRTCLDVGASSGHALAVVRRILPALEHCVAIEPDERLHPLLLGRGARPVGLRVDSQPGALSELLAATPAPRLVLFLHVLNVLQAPQELLKEAVSSLSSGDLVVLATTYPEEVERRAGPRGQTIWGDYRGVLLRALHPQVYCDWTAAAGLIQIASLDYETGARPLAARLRDALLSPRSARPRPEANLTSWVVP